ncbi:hypothetical protein HA402_008737 [Bradysia odoriphaga]|nr:hypothetical protein HA402_008737 [Bradysia odoriphaga]
MENTVECIDKLDQYATATAQDIFKTFQTYHTILQNLEHEAYAELKKRTLVTLQELHNVQNSIDVSGTLIAGAISNIKQFEKVTPKDVDLSAILNKIMTFLETLMIDFDVDQFDHNLFRFNSNSFKTSCDLKDLCKIKFENIEFYAKMQTFFTAKKLPTEVKASSHYADLSSDSSIAAPDSPVKSMKLERTVKSQSVHKPKDEPTIKSREVYISEISDSMIFYVQDVDFIERSDRFLRQCNQSAMIEKQPSTVLVGEMYLVFETNKDEWYRGIVTEQKTKITLYLVDHGRHVSVMLNQIRQISDNLKTIPQSSSSFTLCNVEPTGSEWSDVCKELILQMALEKRATIIYAEENTGDCIVHLDYPTSVEDTLLYLEFAKARKIHNESANKLHRQMMREKKLIMDRLNTCKPFVKHKIKDESYCKAMNIVSPAQLYITSMDHVSDVEALHKQIQEYYETPYLKKVYYPHLQMPCCVWIDENWYRARIEDHRPNCVVKVYLVDVGKYENIEWRFLRTLENQFNDLPEGVVECCLAHISPKDYADEWGSEVTDELKRLCKHTLKVGVIGIRNRMVNIELYIIKKKKNYQINAYLAKYNLVEWIGEGEWIVERRNDADSELTDESGAFAPITNSPASKEFRQLIKILNAVSPSEFYVTLTKYENAIKKMHTEIQNLMKSHVAENAIQQWQGGDHCLVFGKLSKELNKCWYRGRIESIRVPETNMDNIEFCTYIRDHGQTVIAQLSDLAPISESLRLVDDGAMKCHMANLKPTLNEWAKSAIDEFKFILREECDTFAISVHGEITSDSIPVYLWGRAKAIKDDALGAPGITWTNINSSFATKGYADCAETFKTIVDCNPVDIMNKEMVDFNKWLEKLSLGSKYQATANQKHILCDEDDFILEAELDPDHQSFCTRKVTAWLPAKPISKYFFNGFVTYVDNNAVIYLHEQSRSSFLKQMMYTINKKIGQTEYDPSYKWVVNEPCMAKFYLDNCFYRATVKEILPNDQYKIMFVDYGNIETCDSCDLRIADILGNVPIQTTKYYLAYVQPINDKGIWDKKILEFIHYHIVNKTVAVRVEDNIDNEFVPCTLTVGVMDLIKTLIAEKLAENSPTLEVKLNMRETYSFYSQKSSEGAVPDCDLHRKSSEPPDKFKSSIPLDEFKIVIEKKKEAAKVKEHVNQFDFDLSADFIVEDSDADAQVANSFLRDSIDYDGDFQPHDTSTTISTAMKSFSLLPFKPIKLGDHLTKFPCKIYEVLDTLHLFVEPLIPEYTDSFESMENAIKKSKHKKSGFNISSARCCLAPYTVDNLYYRAVINDRINKTTARIRFADYLNEEVVDCKLLRECPADAVEHPLKHIIVKLHGIKPTRRIRDSDIKRQLETLLDQTAIAVVVTNDTIPSVRLFDSNSPDLLLYKSLIDSKFYTEMRD